LNFSVDHAILSFFLFFFLYFFLLSHSALFLLLIVGVEVYCCTLSHAVTHTQSVGLPWTRDRSLAETSNWTTRNSHAPTWNSNEYSSKGAGALPTP